VKFGEKLDEYSTDQEIKSAYRRLAKKFHPDAGAKSADPFKQIAAAYSRFDH
jgi:curved DNA-binding protein CbpA